MMACIIEGQALSKASGSPPLDIHDSRRCFFSSASSLRASSKRSCSFSRACSRSQMARFSRFSLARRICSSMLCIVFYLLRNSRIICAALFRISTAFLVASLHARYILFSSVGLGWLVRGMPVSPPALAHGLLAQPPGLGLVLGDQTL